MGPPPTSPAPIARPCFVPESRGNPLGCFPSLSLGACPYNLWLADRVLDPVLERWARPFPNEADAAAMVAEDIERASGLSRSAFREVLPAATRLGDPAVLAVLAVTANLQRTLALVAELRLGREGSLAAGSARLSRFLCGLVEYPENSPYFPGPLHPPAHADRLPPRRRDPRHLGNVLWCSVREINRRCDQALALLRDEVRRGARAREFAL